ncbi:MAG: hypothetical protein H6828_09330 [Planctomycetes bacterium]|nr:hypothetical protein [Planctomycetota bacterium]
MLLRNLLTAFLTVFLTFLAGAAPQVEGLDLKDEIDASVRWLRQHQGADGSYGGGIEGTAWALTAFARGPRAYVRGDGPFMEQAFAYLEAHQHDSGGIYAEGASDVEKSTQSTLAWLALREFDDQRTQATLKKLNGFFALPIRPEETPALSPAEAREQAVSLLKARQADKSWGGADGAVIETSRAILALTRCRAALQEASAPRPTTKLPAVTEVDRAAALDAMRRGALFLVATGEDGLWGAPGHPDLGLTAMVLGALEELPTPRDARVQKVIDDGLKWLVAHQDADGAIHDGKLKNYLTSASILALAKSGDPQWAPNIAKARDFVVRLQADEGEGYSDGDLYYGGIGYGDDERPDLSNLQMALEALDAAGMTSKDEAFRRALKFLERVQNRSESNDTRLEKGGTVIHSGDDGGAGYAPADSKAGFETLADGTKVPRSYGSMSYALLRGYVFVGLSKDDPRMQAAWKWVREHYTLDVNPGFEQAEDPSASYQGLFYYFHSMAKALDLYGEEVIVDGQGKSHAWRRQLCGRLVAMQRKDDGSWLNENSPRWWEGNPVMATAYALLTLGAALPAESTEH